MKHLLSPILPISLAVSFNLLACSDDDSSNNVEREEYSSSVEISSSSDETSSSSAEKLPGGLRVATLEDLPKNMDLGKMFGTNVYLATGLKKGVFSLWIPDTAWFAVRSEFKDGVLEYNKNVGSIMWGSGIAVADSMKAFFEKGGNLKFVVKDDSVLQYSANGGDYKTVANASVKTSQGWVSSGEDLAGSLLICKSQNVTQKYSLFDGRYLVKETIGDSTNWQAGYYDVERSHLFLLPVFTETRAYYPMISAQVSADYKILAVDGGLKYDCEKSELKMENLDTKNFEGEWVAYADSLDWSLTLNKNGEFTMNATMGSSPEDLNSGIWDVYNNILFLKNLKCSAVESCENAVYGEIQGFDKEKGFTFEHNRVRKPLAPKTWTVPQYE